MATFADWIEPFAHSFREHHDEAVRLARSLTSDQLKQPTGDTGWSVREEMLHIAASDPDFLNVLGAIVRGEAPDTSVFADVDKRNARNLSEWASRSMAEVATELESNGAALQRLLSQLSADDASRQPEGVPFSIERLIAGYGQHGLYHVGQIHKAIGQS